MQYILTQEEYDGTVSSKIYKELTTDLVRTQEKLNTALHYFKSGGECNRVERDGFCDDCVLASMNLKKNFRICNDERYSK